MKVYVGFALPSLFTLMYMKAYAVSENNGFILF